VIKIQYLSFDIVGVLMVWKCDGLIDMLSVLSSYWLEALFDG